MKTLNVHCKNPKRVPAVTKWITVTLAVAGSLFAPCAFGQTTPASRAPDALHQLNDSVESLVQRVSPSVVQILVSGYSSTQDTDQGQMSVVIGKQRTIGSGVIVDPEGYIVTNAHVVKGAEKIEVIVPPPVAVQNGPKRSAQPRTDVRALGSLGSRGRLISP